MKSKLHVPCPTRVLDVAMVEMILAKVQNRFIAVTFYKVDGTESKKTGQLKAVSRLVGNAKGQAQGERMKDAGQVWMALPTPGKSASFYKDRVKSITFDGTTYGIN